MRQWFWSYPASGGNARGRLVQVGRLGHRLGGNASDEFLNMAGSWGCPHEINGLCHKVGGQTCDPGMKGCVLYGRYVFANPAKNARIVQKQGRRDEVAVAPGSKISNDSKE